jgi:hypothetical protein
MSQGVSGPVGAGKGNTMTLNQHFRRCHSHYFFLYYWRTHIYKTPFTTLYSLETEFVFVQTEELHVCSHRRITQECFTEFMHPSFLRTPSLVPLEPKCSDSSKIQSALVHKS